MVFRVFVEKKAGLAHEADALFSDLTDFLGIRGLTGVRIANRYDADGITPELFE